MARSAAKPKEQSFSQGRKSKQSSSKIRGTTRNVSSLTSQSVKGRSALSAAQANAAVRCSQFMVAAKDLQPVVFEGIGSKPVQITDEHLVEQSAEYPMDNTIESLDEEAAKFPMEDNSMHLIDRAALQPIEGNAFEVVDEVSGKVADEVSIEGTNEVTSEVADATNSVPNTSFTANFAADKREQKDIQQAVRSDLPYLNSVHTIAASLSASSLDSVHTIAACSNAASKSISHTINAQTAASLTRSLFSDEEKACLARLVQTAGGVGTGKVAYISRLPSWQIAGSVDSSKVKIVEGLNAKSSQLNLATKAKNATKRSSLAKAYSSLADADSSDVSSHSYNSAFCRTSSASALSQNSSFALNTNNSMLQHEAYVPDYVDNRQYEYGSSKESQEHVIHDISVSERNLQARDRKVSKQNGSSLDRGRVLEGNVAFQAQYQRGLKSLSESSAEQDSAVIRNLSSSNAQATGASAAFDHCSISNQGEFLSKGVDAYQSTSLAQKDVVLQQPQQAQVVYCPVEMSLSLLGGKYKALILWKLLECGTLRFLQLRRLIPKATAKILTQQLRELEEHGLVRRTVYPVVPPKVEYSLTDLGITIQPLLEAMYDWGSRYLLHLGHPINCSMSLLHSELPKIDAMVHSESKGNAKSMQVMQDARGDSSEFTQAAQDARGAGAEFVQAAQGTSEECVASIHLVNNSTAAVVSDGEDSKANLASSASISKADSWDSEHSVHDFGQHFYDLGDSVHVEAASGVAQDAFLLQQNSVDRVHSAVNAPQSSNSSERDSQLEHSPLHSNQVTRKTLDIKETTQASTGLRTRSLTVSGSKAEYGGQKEDRPVAMNPETFKVQETSTRTRTGIKVPRAHAPCPLSGV